MDPTPSDPTPPYLRPYLRAARTHGPSFKALLWASPQTQAARFDAFTRLYDFAGKSIADIGCGRGDFLDYLRQRQIDPESYVGIEAVEALADEAARLHPDGCRIVRADFVQQPHRLFVGADAVVFSGSLNTLDEKTFYATIRTAFESAADALLFNFLSGPQLAGQKHLLWHHPADLLAHVRSLGAQARRLDDYLDGDCTLMVRH